MNKIEFGDCRDIMRRWAAEGVKAQMCVTSPPYFGLRDYGHDGQIGLEETPEEYITAMVEVFRCVRDVLADDGTLWLNIGDSYAGSGGAGGQYKPGGIAKTGTNAPSTWSAEYSKKPVTLNVPGCKPKDLIGIPWMLAFALRADGWYLRQDIIWHKPNPMPESVRDRCTKAHEYIFLMSKSERYFFDSEAMQEPAQNTSGFAKQRAKNKPQIDNKPAGIILGRATDPNGGLNYASNTDTRNRRSVWTVPIKPYEGAHFAVYPTELIEPCIMAGSKVGDIVLDPFMGSGTTAQVAKDLGRKYLGCELNPSYKELQDKRLRQLSLELA